MKIQPPDPIDIRPYLSPIVRYRSLILTFCLAATASSVAFTFLVAERYKANTTILYQPREVVSFRPKSRDALGFPPPLVPLESIGNTLQEMLKSDAIVESVVLKLGLHVKEPRPRTHPVWTLALDAKDTVKEWRGNVVEILKYGRVLQKDPVRQAMATLQSNVSIKRTAKAYTFELEAVHENPVKAATIVDTIGPMLAQFLASEQARSARESREKIEPRLRAASKEIEDIRSTVEQFKSDTGVSSLSEELSFKLKLVNELEQSVVATSHELRATERNRAELETQLAQQAPNVRYESTVSENPIAEDMKLAIARLEVERSGLLEQLTSNHPQVKATDAKLEEARQMLAGQQVQVVSSESTRVNDLHRKLLSEKLEAEAKIHTLRARERSVTESIKNETTAARKLSESWPQIADMTLRLKSAESVYELIHESYEEARLAEARTTSEVMILYKALVPSAPARPIKIVHVASSFVLSLFLAIGLALFTNVFDSTVRTIDQAERALGCPVLATIDHVAPAHQTLLRPRSST